MVITFRLHYLGHRIRYGNLAAGNTTQQLLLAPRSCSSSEFLESFLFKVILVTYNIGIFICVYIYEVSYICSFFVIFNCNVFFCIACKTFWDMKKYFVKLMSWLLLSAIHQVMWYLWMCIVKPFCLLWNIFSLKKIVFPFVSLSLAYRWVNQLRYFW